MVRGCKRETLVMMGKKQGFHPALLAERGILGRSPLGAFGTSKPGEVCEDCVP